MAESMQDNIRGAIEATQGQPEPIVAAAVQGAANAPVPPPPPPALNFIWRTLVVGLVLILVIALLGIIWVVQDANVDTSPDVLITVFTTSLAGLLGLFVKSPSNT